MYGKIIRSSLSVINFLSRGTCSFSFGFTTILSAFPARFYRSFQQDRLLNIRTGCLDYTWRYVCAMSGNNLWQDRGFPTTHLDHLPCLLQSDDDAMLTIDYARIAEVTSSLSGVVSDAAARGDNVGTDETTYQLESIATAEIFTAKWVSGNIAAFVLIAPSTTAGSYDPCLADVHVIRSRDVSDATYASLVRQAVQLTRKLNIGYTDCLMSVSTSCEVLVRTLGGLGFTTAATIPQCIRIAGVGLTDTVLMTQNLGIQDRPPRSKVEVLQMLAKMGLSDGVASDAEFQQRNMPRLPFLPRPYKLQSGLSVNLRDMRKEDDVIVFKLLRDMIDGGDGFALHSFPIIAVLRHYLMRRHWVVVEEVGSQTLVGIFSFRQSRRMRTSVADCCTSIMALDKAFQNRGIGQELMLINLAMAKELGYGRIINSFYNVNVRMKAAGNKIAKSIGTIPRVGYMNGQGWAGTMVMIMSSDAVPTFTQMVQRNRLHSSL